MSPIYIPGLFFTASNPFKIFIDLAPYVELISYDVIDPTLLPESCFESVLQFNVPEISDEEIYLDINRITLVKI